MQTFLFLENLDMSIKKTVSVALSVAVVAGASFFSNLSTAAGYMVEWTYYSDASHTVDVGWKLRTCNGKIYKGGTQTAYYDVFSEPCWGGGIPR